MHEAIQRIVGKNNVSESEQDLEAYSYDGSCMRAKPLLVAWPQCEEDVQKIILYCIRSKLAVVARGRGTNLVGSAIGEQALILDFSLMSKLLNVNAAEDYVVAEPGITVQELNTSLFQYNKIFPIFPEEMTTTIGGLIAGNLCGPYSQGLGRVKDWVQQLECCDGTGKLYQIPNPEDIVGYEGTTGIITKAKLRVTNWPLAKSADLFSFNNIPHLLKKVADLNSNKSTLSIEFMDKITSAYSNLGSKYSLLVEYASNEGKINLKEELKHLAQKRSSIYSTLRLKKYYALEDPKVPFEKIYDLIEWCQKYELPCYGHIGLSTLKIMFRKEQKHLIENLYSLVRDFNGFVSGEFGYGLKKKRLYPPALKHKLIKIKERTDYNNVLNRGKLIDFI